MSLPSHSPVALLVNSITLPAYSTWTMSTLPAPTSLSINVHGEYVLSGSMITRENNSVFDMKDDRIQVGIIARIDVVMIRWTIH